MGFTALQKQQIVENIKRRRIRSDRLYAEGVEAPIMIEVSYYKDLLKVVNEITDQLNIQLLPILKASENEYIKDASPLDTSVDRILQNIFRQLKQIDLFEKIYVKRFTDRTEGYNRRVFVEAINRAIGVNLSNIVKKESVRVRLEESVTQNVQLIRTIPEQYLGRVEQIVKLGFSAGDDFFSIRRSILEIGQSTEKRARLIARDQVAKLNSTLAAQRQQDVGITEYIWSTSGDERVRPTHAANEGKIFSWSSPPLETGHPGEDIQCRCVAQPNFSQLLGLEI